MSARKKVIILLRFRAKELSEERQCEQEGHRYEERWDHTLVYFKHFCGSKFTFYQYFNGDSQFQPTRRAAADAKKSITEFRSKFMYALCFV